MFSPGPLNVFRHPLMLRRPLAHNASRWLRRNLRANRHDVLCTLTLAVITPKLIVTALQSRYFAAGAEFALAETGAGASARRTSAPRLTRIRRTMPAA
jgi:hypothetical protein